MLVGRTVYGESQPNPEANNLRGKVVQLFDQAGVVTSDDYDFKGNLLAEPAPVGAGVQGDARLVDRSGTWNPRSSPASTRYDALNRPIIGHRAGRQRLSPHLQRGQPARESRRAICAARPSRTPFVTDIDYDAKGQRTLIDYGNGVRTTYDYDPLTFRLTHLQTTRGAERLAGSELHLRSGRQHHAHPRRRPADDLLQ